MSRLVASGVLVGVAVMLAIAAMSGSNDSEGVGVTAATEPVSVSTVPTTQAIPERLGQGKDLLDLDGWLQTDATSLADIDAPVKVIQFWTFGCSNCKNTLPYLQDLYAKYEREGLEIIGVHAPEFDHEADVGNIAAAAIDLGVTWPIALDTNKTNFRSWQGDRRFWPRTFVLDSNNEIRFDHIGEGSYVELEATVMYLLDHGA